jgi:hypothetical protein
MGQAFWLSVLLLTLGIQLCYLPIIKWYGGSSTDAGILTITAVIMPLVYLLGICGTIFNREHDNQTFGRRQFGRANCGLAKSRLPCSVHSHCWRC